MIYLDNAATTRLKKEALEAMMPYLTDNYANPSSVHKMARGPRNAVDEARKSIANAINAQKGEIYFTSGGTESDNWVIKCAPKILSDKGKHIIVSSIEHHAIIESARYMESQGYDVTYLKVDENGLVDMDELVKCLLDKNPDIRMVINAVTIETAGEIASVIKELDLAEEEIISVSVDRTRKVGRYHLMDAQNPVYIAVVRGR